MIRSFKRSEFSTLEVTFSNYFIAHLNLYIAYCLCRTTLGENIADNGGLKAAYKAYFDDGSHDKDSFPIENLKLTTEQLFFVSYGQVWCSDNSEQYEVNKMVTNPHPPSRLRVAATLGNSEDFSKAFQCPEGSAMNPSKKCSLW